MKRNPNPIARKWANRHNPNVGLETAMVAVVDAIGDYNADRKNDSSKSWWLQFGTLVFAGFVTIATAAAAIFAYLAQKEAGRQVAVAREQVEAAREQVRNANAIAISQQRAWIVPGPISFEDVPPGEKHWIVQLPYKNSGHQPAQRLHTMVRHFPVPASQINDTNYLRNRIITELGGRNCKEAKGTSSGYVVYPQSTSGIRLQISPEDAAKYIKHTHYLAVAGYITYETFGAVRRSCFCQFMDFSSDRTKPAKWQPSVCRVHQYAD